MDTVYSTKKYFQSLGSDYYRSPSVARQITNDYTSYQNTMGRRSTIGPYTHMSKYSSYPTEPSLSSHYGGYNGWGLWRDTGNLSPALSVTKKRSIKSFSIILMTAAFIVVLAVLSVAGLSFYFSTFRSDLDDSMLAFDGQFQVIRGDVYTTGLKYNHTSTYRQKRSYYEKLIDSALEMGGFTITKCEITDFGPGPLVHVKYRVFLDMKSMPLTMTNVEESIKNSLLQEVTSPHSSFRNIKIDPDSMEVKRLLDHDVLKSASFIREIDMEDDPVQATKDVSFEEKVSKKSGVIEKTIHKFSSTTKMNTPAPKLNNFTQPGSVVKGTFEITKTEADISEKKDTPPSLFHTTSTLRPNLQKATMRVKSPVKSGAMQSVENSHVSPPSRPIPGKVDKVGKISTTTTTTTTTEKTTTMESSTSSLLPSSTSPPTTTTTRTTMSSIYTKHVSQSTIPDLIPDQIVNKMGLPEESEIDLKELSNFANNPNPPQLDVNLFTSAPILDKQPWHPISPNKLEKPYSSKKQTVEVISLPPQEKQEEMLLYRNKAPSVEMPTVTKSPSGVRPVYYQSYTNPTFSMTTMGIERLGAADVKPYPLPVNKLYDDNEEEVIQDGVPLNQGEFEFVQKPAVKVDEYDDRFEHLGGGVIAKKPEPSSASTEEDNGYEGYPTTESMKRVTPLDDGATSSESTSGASAVPIELSSTEENKKETPSPEENNEKLGDILYDLLELNGDRDKFIPPASSSSGVNGGEKERPESRIEEEEELAIEGTTTKINFINIKEHILNMSRLAERNESDTSSEVSTVTSTSGTGGVDQFTQSSVEVTSEYASSPSWEGPALYPMHTTWELINGSSNSNPESNATPMKRIYNDTLQAWIVENSEEEPQPNSVRKDDISSSKKQEGTIQNISVIFDTLASKLGITPDTPSKSPPFQNKPRNRTTTTTTTTPRATTTTTEASPATSSKSLEETTSEPTTIKVRQTTTTKKPKRKVTIKRKSSTTPKPQTTTTTEAPTTTTEVERTTTTSSEELSTAIHREVPPLIQLDSEADDIVPIMLVGSSQESTTDHSAGSIFGKAEVEIVDPTVYEDLLRKQTTAMPLVTLMPVRSNSGIRTFRPPIKRAGDESFRALGRLPPPPHPARIVSTSMIVDV